MRLLAILIFALTLFACRDDEPCAGEGCFDEMACTAAGGAPTYNGFGARICLMPTSDGDRPCTSNTDCEDTCLFADTTTVACEARTQGRCSSTYGHFGCQCVALENGGRAHLCSD